MSDDLQALTIWSAIAAPIRALQLIAWAAALPCPGGTSGQFAQPGLPAGIKICTHLQIQGTQQEVQCRELALLVDWIHVPWPVIFACHRCSFTVTVTAFVLLLAHRKTLYVSRNFLIVLQQHTACIARS